MSSNRYERNCVSIYMLLKLKRFEIIETETDFITALIVGEIIIQLLGQDRARTYSSAR